MKSLAVYFLAIAGSLSGCGKPNADLIAEYINAQATSIKLGSSDSKSISPYETGLVAKCNENEYQLRDGSFVGNSKEGDSSALGGGLVMELVTSGNIKASQFSEQQSLYCKMNVAYKVNKDATHLEGNGVITSCDGFQCAFMGEKIECEDLKKALAENSCVTNVTASEPEPKPTTGNVPLSGS